MKLATEIKPRGDGTVIAHIGGVDYAFKPNESGELVCDVHDDHVPNLLATKNFYPLDPGDYASAIETIAPKNEDDVDDDVDDIDGEIKAPIEVKTPLKPSVKKSIKSK